VTCRLLTRIKRTGYTVENKIVKMQMSKKKKRTQHNTQKSTCNYTMKQIRRLVGCLFQEVGTTSQYTADIHAASATRTEHVYVALCRSVMSPVGPRVWSAAATVSSSTRQPDLLLRAAGHATHVPCNMIDS